MKPNTTRRHLAEMSPEQRKAIQEKSLQARQEAQAYAQEHFYSWPLSDSHWSGLASKHGIKLPKFAKKPTGYFLQKYARQLGLEDGSWEEAMFGINYTGSVATAIKKENVARKKGSMYNARCYVGFLLEMFDEMNKEKIDV